MSSETSDDVILRTDHLGSSSDPKVMLQRLAHKIDKTAETSRTKENSAPTLYQAVCVSGETNEMTGDALGLSSARIISIKSDNGDQPVNLRQVKFQIIKGAGNKTPSGWTASIARHDDPTLSPYKQNFYRTLLPWCTSINEDIAGLPIKNGDIINITKRGGAYFYDGVAERGMLGNQFGTYLNSEYTPGSNAFGKPYSGGPDSTMGAPASEEIKQKATAYDENGNIPYKSQHAPFLKKAHTAIVPLIKAFIYECWVQQKTRIRLNSTYRSNAHQQKLYDKWEAGGKKGVKPATPGTSWHNVGGAFDFNPKLKNGTTLVKATDKQTWLSSNVPSIGESLGLRWGGHFKDNYDPVHFDLGAQHSSADKKKALETSKATGKGANKVALG